MTYDNIIKSLDALEKARETMTFEEYIRQRSILNYHLECLNNRDSLMFRNEQKKERNTTVITQISNNYVDN